MVVADIEVEVLSRGELDTYRPTCHLHQAKCVTHPCQRVVIFASEWSKRISCMSEAQSVGIYVVSTPLQRIHAEGWCLRGCHVTKPDPNCGVVSLRL